MKGFGPPAASFAYFSVMLYMAGCDPSGTSTCLRVKHLESLTILRDLCRIAYEVRARVDAHAADDEHVVGAAAFLNLECPGGATVRVSRRE